MSNPLSIFTFFIRNKRRVLPILCMLSASILGVTASAAIAGSLVRDMYKHSSLYSDFYTIHFQPLEADKYSFEDVEAKVKDLKNSDYYLQGELRRTYSTGVFGVAAEWIFYLSPQDQSKFSKVVNWELVEGRMPDNKNNEVVLTEKLMFNKNLKVGDKIGSKFDKIELLSGEHAVVGKLKENGVLIGGIGNLESLTNKDKNLDYTFYIRPKLGLEKELEAELNKIELQYPGIEVRTKTSEAEFNKSQYNIIQSLVWSLNLIVMLVICISVALLNIIYFMQRSKEFGILSALGYSKTFLLRKTFLESLVVTLVSWLIGIIFTEAVYILLNKSLFEPKGIEGLTVLEPSTFIFSLPVPLTVSLFSFLTVLWHFSRMDPISIIEKRE